MAVEYLTGKEARDTIKSTFHKVRELVAPTMGAKGRMAVIDQVMGQPIITDDGVTVVKHLANFTGFEKPIMKSMIEGAHNTEREAFDGTTLTILMTDELYAKGYDMIEAGQHPQDVADYIEAEVLKIIDAIEVHEMNDERVKHVATIATKMPAMGEIVEMAYKKAGKAMDVIIEHKPGSRGINLEHSKGITISCGFQTQMLNPSKENVTFSKFTKAKIALLKSGNMTEHMIRNFFNSIPQDEVGVPIIFAITENFNNEAMRVIIEFMTENRLPFQFIFMNEPYPDDLYLDLAALSDGVVLDPQSGVKDYLYEHCGTFESGEIRVDKSILVGSGSNAKRVTYYTNRLKDKKYKLSQIEEQMIRTRLAGLTSGLVKLIVGTPTLLEFSAIRLKLDDAIGAVRKAWEDGVVRGAGKALYNLKAEFKDFADILTIPHETILGNAGIEKLPTYKVHRNGWDVVKNKRVDLLESGIIDSAASIKYALIHATSIACNYLRCYVLIKEEDPKRKA